MGLGLFSFELFFSLGFVWGGLQFYRLGVFRIWRAVQTVLAGLVSLESALRSSAWVPCMASFRALGFGLQGLDSKPCNPKSKALKDPLHKV